MTDLENEIKEIISDMTDQEIKTVKLMIESFREAEEGPDHCPHCGEELN